MKEEIELRMADIRHSITIHAPTERIYALVSEGTGFAQWWGADVCQVGSAAVEIGFLNRATVYRLKPVAMDPPKQAEWVCESGHEWAATHLFFQISPKNGQRLLRFTHGRWRVETDYFVDCTTVWGHLMFRLKAAAEGKSRGPLFTAVGMAE